MECPRCEGSGRCTDCGGQGSVECPACQGTGQRHSQRLGAYTCNSCKGSGKVECKPNCPSCDGSGQITRELQNRVRDKYEVRVAGPLLHKTLVTPILMALCLLVWTYGAFQPEANDVLFMRFMNRPGSWSTEPWRLVASMFLHVGLVHLLCNMLALLSFGSTVERDYGSVRFSFFYFASGIAGSLLSVGGVGASGAIFGMIGVLCGGHVRFGMYDRRALQQQIMYLVLFTVISLNANIDHMAHLGGIIAGFILGCLIPPPKRR